MRRIILAACLVVLPGCGDFFGPDVIAGNWVSVESYLNTLGTGAAPLRLSISSNDSGTLSGLGSIGTELLTVQGGSLDRSTGDVSIRLGQFAGGVDLIGSVNRSGSEISGVLSGSVSEYSFAGAAVNLTRQ